MRARCSATRDAGRLLFCDASDLLVGALSIQAPSIQEAYRLLFGKAAKDTEVQLGLDFLKEAGRNSPQGVSAWQQYAQVLLSSSSFYYVE